MTASVEPLDIKKWHKSSFYREAVENVVSYNAQLVRDAKTRLPYVDAQTGIAQDHSHLMQNRLSRKRGVLPGQVFSYPQRRWHRETRPVPVVQREPPQEVVSNGVGCVSEGGLIQTLEGGVVTKRSSRIAGLSRKDPTGINESLLVVPVAVGSGRGLVTGSSRGVVVGSVPRESSVVSEAVEEEESPDADADYLDDYDSDVEERRSGRRKRRPPARTRTVTPAVAAPRTSQRGDGADKPFPCSICNRRYKTAASLKAHCTQYHAGETVPPPAPAPPLVTMTRLPTPPEPTGPQVPPESRVAVPLPPPPNLRGKENAKPNPYCDFCLGDSTKNKMVSCANCGRSAHPSCMQFSPALAAIVHTYRWQCIECKSCHFCGTSENDDQLLFCDDCDRGFHMYCIKPPLKEPPEGNWSCGMCYRQR